MTPVSTYWMWTTGTYEVSIDFDLDWRKRYLITGYLTLTDGDDYGHVYISMVCRYSGGDQVLCGLRDTEGDFDLSVTEIVSSTSKVTVTLKTEGGAHRAEGVIYEL